MQYKNRFKNIRKRIIIWNKKYYVRNIIYYSVIFLITEREAKIHLRNPRFVIVLHPVPKVKWLLYIAETRRALSTQTLLRAFRSAALPTFARKTGRKRAFIDEKRVPFYEPEGARARSCYRHPVRPLPPWLTRWNICILLVVAYSSLVGLCCLFPLSCIRD